MAKPMANVADENRRLGPNDRRLAAEDRRNAERVADDLTPRRDPDAHDRRHVAIRRAAAR